jgi:hypothetical protein
MIQIGFVPEADLPELQATAQNYQKLWHEFGSSIVESAKKITGLDFASQKIVATIHNGHSQSHPLMLQATTNRQRSRGDLVHELMHILLVDNNIHSSVVDDNNHGRAVHKLLDLVLFDIYVEVYGRTFARDQVALEKSQNQDYEEAWEWALNKNFTQRQKMFEKYKLESNSKKS